MFSFTWHDLTGARIRYVALIPRI